MSLETILPILGDLTNAERDEVIKSCRMHNGMASKNETIKGTEEDEHIYSAMVQAIKSVIPGAQPMPFHVFRRSNAWGYYQKQITYLNLFVETNFPDLTLVERRALYVIIFEVIVSHLKEFRIPIKPKVIAQNFQTVESLWEKSFPGYIACGMAQAVIRSRVNG